MKIRKVENKDIKEVVDLLNSAKELRENDASYDESYVLKNMHNPVNLILVSEIQSIVVGVLVAEIWKDKAYSYIANIVVHPEYKRQSVGIKLYGYFEKLCKSYDLRTINFFVKKSNSKMQKWSQKNGFKRGELFYYFEKKI